MADLAAALSREHGLPVLDGVACAVRLCESLVGLGLATSKRGGYQVPRGKVVRRDIRAFLAGRPRRRNGVAYARNRGTVTATLAGM